jgi:NAD(P)-dependent dehydrogenase (short-subunit alcohol dehydrogenase family)
MHFANRVVLVTGASRGIGRVIAQQFARRGAQVAVHYHRNREAAEQTCAGLAGGPHTLVHADLTQAEAAAPLIQTVVRDLGRLDIVVNNAGIYEEPSDPQDQLCGLVRRVAAHGGHESPGPRVCHLLGRPPHGAAGRWADCEYLVAGGLSWRAGDASIWRE